MLEVPDRGQLLLTSVPSVHILFKPINYDPNLEDDSRLILYLLSDMKHSELRYHACAALNSMGYDEIMEEFDSHNIQLLESVMTPVEDTPLFWLSQSHNHWIP